MTLVTGKNSNRPHIRENSDIKPTVRGIPAFARIKIKKIKLQFGIKIERPEISRRLRVFILS